MSAAPLKPVVWRCVAPAMQGLRTLMSAAPLKQSKHKPKITLPLRLRTLMSAAPLKHVSREAVRRFVGVVSALS